MPLGSVTVRVAAKDSEAAKAIAARMIEPRPSAVPEDTLTLAPIRRAPGGQLWVLWFIRCQTRLLPKNEGREGFGKDLEAGQSRQNPGLPDITDSRSCAREYKDHPP